MLLDQQLWLGLVQREQLTFLRDHCTAQLSTKPRWACENAAARVNAESSQELRNGKMLNGYCKSCCTCKKSESIPGSNCAPARQTSGQRALAPVSTHVSIASTKLSGWCGGSWAGLVRNKGICPSWRLHAHSHSYWHRHSHRPFFLPLRSSPDPHSRRRRRRRLRALRWRVIVDDRHETVIYRHRWWTFTFVKGGRRPPWSSTIFNGGMSKGARIYIDIHTSVCLCIYKHYIVRNIFI